MTLVNKTFSQLITFTRASSATFVGSNGLIQSTPQSKNLLLWTQEFDQASWIKTELTVTANTTAAPDGTTTAETITPSTNSSRHTLQQNFTSVGATYVWSIYAKPNGYNRITIREPQSSGNGATFDVSTGTVVINIASGVGSIVSVGNGWYRCSMTATETSGTRALQVLVNSNSGSGFEPPFAGDGTSGVFLWGAQVEAGSTATSYTKNDGGLFPPRFDYDPVTLAAKGLLIEEQRTNLLTYSDDFTNAAWTRTDTTVTPNDAVSPDGSTNADTATPTGAAPVVRQTHTTSTTGAYTGSVWLRSASNTNVTLSLRPTGAGSPVSVVCAVTPTWQRFTVNITASAGITNLQFWIEQFSQVINIWGAQLEAGSFATSYIPTVASQVTRAADVASVNTLSPWYNATEGTLYAEYSFNGFAASALPVIAHLGVAGVGNRGQFIILNASVNQVNFNIFDDAGAYQGVASPSGASSLNVIYKAVGAYKANDSAASFSGNAPVTDTSVTLATGLNRLTLGQFGNLTNRLNGHLRRITYYKRRLSNADLQSITL